MRDAIPPTKKAPGRDVNGPRGLMEEAAETESLVRKSRPSLPPNIGAGRQKLSVSGVPPAVQARIKNAPTRSTHPGFTVFLFYLDVWVHNFQPLCAKIRATARPPVTNGSPRFVYDL